MSVPPKRKTKINSEITSGIWYGKGFCSSMHFADSCSLPTWHGSVSFILFLKAISSHSCQPWSLSCYGSSILSSSFEHKFPKSTYKSPQIIYHRQYLPQFSQASESSDGSNSKYPSIKTHKIQNPKNCTLSLSSKESLYQPYWQLSLRRSQKLAS